jgi:hypothetical protein
MTEAAPSRNPVKTVARGYRCAPPVERASLSVLFSAGLTMLTARAINYVRERRRPAPMMRSLGRRTFNLPRRGNLRVHHFMPGLALALTAGAAAILTRADGQEIIFGLPFGTGLALTLDELALLVDADNAYWRSEQFALAGAAAACVCAAAITGHLAWLGQRPTEAECSARAGG